MQCNNKESITVALWKNQCSLFTECRSRIKEFHNCPSIPVPCSPHNPEWLKLSFYLPVFPWADTALHFFWKVQPRGRQRSLQVISVLPERCPCLQLWELLVYISRMLQAYFGMSSANLLRWELEWWKKEAS